MIISNYFFGILLILLSIVPSFNGKQDIENFAKAKISNTINSESQITKISFESPLVPQKNDSFEQISIGSKSAVFIDLDSGEVLYQKNKNLKLPMASTTKLMTALIITEKLKMDDVITVPSFTTRPLDSIMGISPGQRFKVSELLHGLLMESGSDTVMALVSAISTNENEFVALMNEKANLLGLTETQFTNAVGYDDDGHFSTAYDLAKLSKIVLKNKTISEIAAKRSYIAETVSGQKFPLSNTNQLLNGRTYKGLKTGTTFAAGECLISYYESENKKIIGVLLGSNSRFYETDKLIQWAGSNFVWPSINTQ